jgi:hypothetical protein
MPVVSTESAAGKYRSLYRHLLLQPKAGTANRFSGTPHKGTMAGMQGKPVSVSKWTKEKGIKCPPPVIAQAGR